MSFAAMQVGVSGLSAISKALAVVSDNIANINTTGFKSSRAIFSDVLSQSLGEGIQIGRGVQLAAVSRDFSRGSVESSSSPTDLAIDGEGLFIVKNNTGQFYSRAGSFTFDKNNLLVNPSGLKVQGFKFDPTTSTFSTAFGDISTASVS